MRLIRSWEAARMLGIDADTLRRRTKGREYLEIYGVRIRVYRMDVNPDSERRFDADEITRALAGLQKAR